jgi:hypothetical protein
MVGDSYRPSLPASTPRMSSIWTVPRPLVMTSWRSDQERPWSVNKWLSHWPKIYGKNTNTSALEGNWWAWAGESPRFCFSSHPSVIGKISSTDLAKALALRNNYLPVGAPGTLTKENVGIPCIHEIRAAFEGQRHSHWHLSPFSTEEVAPIDPRFLVLEPQIVRTTTPIQYKSWILIIDTVSQYYHDVIEWPLVMMQ